MTDFFVEVFESKLARYFHAGKETVDAPIPRSAHQKIEHLSTDTVFDFLAVIVPLYAR